jgi:hypothetical protein
MFKGWFPDLKDFQIDENNIENTVRKYTDWYDPVIWKIKNAAHLNNEAGNIRGRYRPYGQVNYNPNYLGNL